MTKKKSRSLALSGLLLALSAQAAPPSAQDLLAEIQDSRKTSSFEKLLKDWQSNYGTPAVSPLLQLAANKRIEEAQRYVALMGAAKLGGASIAPLLLPLLKDSSWMIRSGTLKALSVLHNFKGATEPEIATAILPLLKDPALVVRLEAIATVELLRPEGTEDALLSVLERPQNYHRRIAQWVPQRALKALQGIRSKKAVSQLLPLLDRTFDPSLQKATLQALEQITGKSLDEKSKNLPLPAQILKWKGIALTTDSLNKS
jgi:HEAT repeat protein